jgi:PAS domain S-box-containing protein
LENSFDSSRRALALIDLDCRFVLVNQRFAELLGLPREKIVGRICHELVHNTPVCIDGCLFSGMRENRSGETLDYEDPVAGKWFRIAVDPIFDGDGEIAGALYAVSDITSTILAEREAARQAVLMEMIQRISSSVITEAGFEGIPAMAAEGLCTFLGAPRCTILFFDDPVLAVEHRVAEEVLPATGLYTRCRCPHDTSTSFRNGESVFLDDIRECPSYGEKRDELETLRIGSLLGVPLRSPEGPVGAIYLDFPSVHHWTPGEIHAVELVARNLSIVHRHSRIYEENRGTADQLSSLLQNVPGAVYRGLRNWSLQFFGAEIERMTGYSPEEFLRGERDWRTVVHPDDLPALKERFRMAVAAKEKVVRVTYRIRRRDGLVRWVEDHRQKIYDADGRFSRVDGLLLDVTEQKTLEDAVLQIRNDWEDTFDNMMDAVTVHDAEFNIVRANRAARELLKLPILNGTPLKCCKYYHGTEHPPEDCPSCNCLSTKLPYSFEVFEPHLDIHMELRAIPRLDRDRRLVGLIHVVRDITERKRREEDLRKSGDMLRQSQKMEAVGQLAGGVAHDFNNLLTVIGGYSDLLAQKLPPESPYRRDVEEIRKAGTRASSLTRQLLAFSRKQVIAPRVADLNEVVAGMEKMLRRLIGEDIDLVTVLRPGLWNVRIDTGQVEQVLLNLAVNARDAMPGVGKLLVETENGSIGEGLTERLGFGVPGEYVILSVRDNGSGMDEETLSHIFEPFFTTKETGKGTGLGLATVYGIVKQSDGYITAESRPGEGATFRIFLPRCYARSESDLVETHPRHIERGRETVLLVEDDEMVRNYMLSALSSGGYSLLEAANGEEAVALLQGSDRPVDLVITDVIMPKMGGKDLSDWLLANRPEVKVIFVSGYVDNDLLREQRFERGETYLQKPFTPEALLRTVRKVFDPAGEEAPAARIPS